MQNKQVRESGTVRGENRLKRDENQMQLINFKRIQVLKKQL